MFRVGAILGVVLCAYGQIPKHRAANNLFTGCTLAKGNQARREWTCPPIRVQFGQTVNSEPNTVPPLLPLEIPL